MDIADVKNKLSSDEKVLESAFRLETIYKRHKSKLWIVIILVIGFFTTQGVISTMNEAKLVKANEAFITLQINNEDQDALKILKENNLPLFELYSYAKATKDEDVRTLNSLVDSKNSIISDISEYTVEVFLKRAVDSKVYHDMALFQEAYLAIQSGDKNLAKDKLTLINENSSLSVVTKFLEHSTIIKAN